MTTGLADLADCWEQQTGNCTRGRLQVRLRRGPPGPRLEGRLTKRSRAPGEASGERAAEGAAELAWAVDEKTQCARKAAGGHGRLQGAAKPQETTLKPWGPTQTARVTESTKSQGDASETGTGRGAPHPPFPVGGCGASHRDLRRTWASEKTGGRPVGQHGVGPPRVTDYCRGITGNALRSPAREKR